MRASKSTMHDNKEDGCFTFPFNDLYYEAYCQKLVSCILTCEASISLARPYRAMLGENVILKLVIERKKKNES